MADTNIKSILVTQDMFPGAWIEPQWNKLDQIKNAAYYALRLCLTDKVFRAPRGRQDYIGITLEGCEYVIHKDNYKVSLELKQIFIENFLRPKGYLETNVKEFLRTHPDILIDALKFLLETSESMLSVPPEKVKMLFVRPDHGACAHYRSYLPYCYLKENPSFHTEFLEFSNISTMHWFDAFIMHRYPNQQLLAIFQNLKNAGKIVVFEYDDDIFNVPDWNPSAKKIDAEAIGRAYVGMEMSDLIIASTEKLVELAGTDKAMHGPNLIKFDGQESLKCSRRLNQDFVGYQPVNKNGKLVFCAKNRKLEYNHIPSSFDPIRILWTGSNTHDRDLDEIVKPVVKIGEKYGMAVMFIFFGHCPSEFVEVQTEAGLTNPKIVVKDRYRHFVSYIGPVKMADYMKTIRAIDPDFALCPLSKVPFNLSKSNLKVLELGSLGVPCIVSDYGPYQFLPKDCGVKVDTGWVSAISDCIEFPVERKNAGENIRAMVYNDFSWDTNSPNRRKWDAIFTRIHELKHF